MTKSLALTSSEGSGYENSTPTYSGTEGAMYFYLPSVDSKVTYTFKVRNVGVTEAVLDYVFSVVSDGTVKCKIGGLYGGEKLVQGDYAYITIEFSYWEGIITPITEPISALINLEFVPNKDGYSNNCTLTWDGSSTSEPAIRNIYGVDYYQISNANELAWFANTVNSGNDAIHAILTNDICIGSNIMSHIGTSNYGGIFDGQNRKIHYNYEINSSYYDDVTINTGIFAVNTGYS